MPDPDQYAAAQAALLRDDWQYSRIFATTEARPGFTALLALRAELQQVQVHTGEPGIAAMKFEWWRSEIVRGFEGAAQHPLARALGNHLRNAGCAAEYCIELVDAAETEGETDARFSEQDFRLYLYRSGGVLAELLAQLSGRTERNTLNAARQLGQLKRLTDMMLATGAMLRAGRWLFPAAWLDDHAPTGAISGSDPAMRDLLNNMLAVLDQQRIAARTAMEDCALPAALALQWSLVQRDYTNMRREPGRMLSREPRQGNALARLWCAWRAARASA